ncbi:hypothetical protein H6503_02015 [Candidatus Woesearchaeota archaeon]|nr:hypothetical protein [Candidatus Woesearchaeota archaeon]
MKKGSQIMMILSVLTILLCTIMAVSAASTNVIADKDIRLTLVNQEPDPVEPGEYVKVKFKVENWGSEPTAPIVVGLKPSFPFEVVDGDYEQTIPGLERRQKADDSEIVEWRLLIDKNAAEGANNLTVYYRELSGQRVNIISEEEFDIEVRTSDTILEVVDIMTVPEDVEPGQTSKLILKVKNLADSFIKDVKISLDLEDVNIATIGSTSEKIIQKLDGGETVNVEFDIMPSSSVALGTVKIPLNMEFKDNLNNKYTQNSTFGLVLNSPVSYILNVESSEILSLNQKGDVTVQISNNGINNIQFLTVELKQSKDYKILSSPKIYIGQVDSDDFESITYTLYSNDTDDFGNMNLRLLLTYTDDYNKEYNVEEEVPIKIFTAKEIKDYGLVPSGNGGMWLLIIIVVAGVFGFLYYRKRKKKKQQQQQKQNKK